VQAHGFGVNGDGAGGEDAFGQVFFVQVYGHSVRRFFMIVTTVSAPSLTGLQVCNASLC
jgi:hypothetical protein